MIRFSLICEQAHTFESWFPNGAAYDAQRERNLVRCPICDNATIEKAVMAPMVLRRDSVRESADEDQRRRLFWRSYCEAVQQNTVDVGEHFAQEARDMHQGLAPERAIRGRVTAEDAAELIEEGVPVFPLPDPPDDHH